ncbi:MAG TPA: T9SS type A sorting domain-containing protein [Flavobacteriales bacterium]|nr:T9SS type A sorting domain-containing protein [Flavobacteriales bacterium]
MQKSLRILIAGFLSLAGFGSNAQTVLNAGKLEGSLTTKTHVERMLEGPMDQNILVGWYTDSLQLDIESGGYTLISGGPGSKSAFIASYSPDGLIGWGVSMHGTTTADSCIIRAVFIDGNNDIYVGGSYWGTIDFDGGVGVTNHTAVSGGDAFLAKYDSFGNFMWVSQLETSGIHGGINTIAMTSDLTLYVGGFFDGTIDLDPSGATANFNTVANIDGFIAGYDYSSGYHAGNTQLFAGSGDETIETMFITGSDDYYFTGQFSTDVDVDPGAAVVTYTNATGGADAFLGHLWASLTYDTSIQLAGSAGTVTPVDMHNDGGYPVVLFDFDGNFDMNPFNPGFNIANTTGLYDVALCRYDGSFNLMFGKTFGNAGQNHGYFLTNENGAMASRSSFYMYLFTMSFSGTLDVDPNAGTVNVTSSNTPVNSVGITIDDIGDYFTHFANEAHTMTGVAINGNDPNQFTVAGNFRGTNVDIAPLGAVSLETHTVPNFAGYYVFYDRCALMVDVVLDEPYECGTNTASLTAVATNAAGFVNYNWSTGYWDSTLVVSDGTYFCEVGDDFGCSAVDTIHIGHYGAPALDATITPVSSSCGNNVGSASAVPVSNLGAVTYAWSSGETTSMADSLAAGFYTLQISDTTGCFVIVPFDISDADGPTVTLNSTSAPLCGGLSTGTVDVTVSGGAAPITYTWSNGATTEDITGVPGGSYALIATDVNGCVGQICVTISQPDPVSIIQNDLIYSNCLGATGQIMIQPQGGTAPYTIQWDASTGFQTNDTVVNLAAGIYNVTITDAAGCTYNEYYGVGDQEYWWAPYIYYNSEIAASCTGGLGSTFVDVSSGWGTTFNFEWETGATTEDLLNVPGGKHVLLAYDSSGGCYSTYTTYLYSVQPNIPDVCMVTVDSTGTQNVVVYDETTTPEAVYYKIYREGFCGDEGFNHVGTVDRDSLSVFYDTVVNSDTRSWKYYVTAVDSCGQESSPSIINKTIHLTIHFNSSFDLVCNWEAYEGQPVNGYNVYRLNPSGTAFDSIFNVGPTTLTWIDTTNFSAWTGDIEYFVEGIPVSACYASRAYNQNNARSNHAKAFVIQDTTSGSFIPEVNLEEIVKIYPNPANDRVNIRIQGGTADGYTVDMLDQVGQLVRSFSLNGEAGISTRDLNAGVYFVRVTNIKFKQTKTFKLVIQR